MTYKPAKSVEWRCKYCTNSTFDGMCLSKKAYDRYHRPIEKKLEEVLAPSIMSILKKHKLL